MTDELTDADLDRIGETVENGDLDMLPKRLVRRLLDEHRALRSRRAQDTPSDPAAPEPYQWAVEGPDVRTFDMEDDAREFAESWNATQEEGLLPVLVFPLYRDRAPGAVAAAPTEDEVEHGGACNDGIEIAHGAGPNHVYVCRGECLDDEPAPSAGEDEAAVERVAAYLRGCGDEGPEDDEVDAAWGNGEGVPRPLLRSDLYALVAAARGPRTQDDT